MTNSEKIADLLNHYPANAHVFVDDEPKKSGGMRTIAKPNRDLKKWLRKMNSLLQEQFLTWPDCMHGGIKRRSYVTYARPHVGKRCVITVDIKACFDSITEKEVYETITRHLQLPETTAKQLARRLCFRRKVAQGFPTSNFVCNLYLLDTLVELDMSFKGQRLSFGNYVDDLAISGAIREPHEVVNAIAIALSHIRLKMNKAKIEIMPAHKQQIICGLLVNKRLSLTQQLKARLLGEVNRHEMGEASLAGWLVNLRNVDNTFANKLRGLAIKRGY